MRDIALCRYRFTQREVNRVLDDFKKKWRAVLMLLIIVILGIGLFLFGFNGYIESRLEQDIHAYMGDITRQSVRMLQNSIQSLSTKVELEAKFFASAKNMSESQFVQELENFAKDESITRATIIAQDGTVYSSEFGVQHINPADYANAPGRTQTYISDIRRFEETGQYFIDVSTPLLLNGENVGILAVSYDSAALSKLFSVEYLSGDCNIHLIAADGAAISKVGSRPSPPAFNGNFYDFYAQSDVTFVHGSPQELQEKMRAGDSYTIKLQSGGETYCAFYMPVGIRDWYLATDITDVTLKAQARNLQTKAAIFTTAIIITFTALLIYILRQMRKIAYVDALTGAPNRKKLIANAENILQNSRSKHAFIVLDIDQFKVFNDNFGYQCGDALLVKMAQVIKQSVHMGETFGRSYGDVFALLVRYTHEQELKTRIETLHSQIQAFVHEQIDSYYNLVICSGVYAISDNKENINSMIDKARQAHMLIKGSAISDIAFYTEHMWAHILADKKMENKMRAALIDGEFDLYLQPKFNLSTAQISGAEALVRWSSPDGMIYPDDFVPLFEKNGFIVQLDMYMLEKVCKHIKGRLDAGLTPVTISINFSREHLENPNFVDDISALVDRYQVPHNLIEIELTESTILENESVVIHFLQQLHAQNYTLSMDDFGSGYSSLGLLKSLPVDIIKLDKTFFAQYTDINRAKIVISCVVDMAKQLHIQIVAEGVETADNAALVTQLGCDVAQGYYYAKPMPQAEFEQLLADTKAVNAYSI